MVRCSTFKTIEHFSKGYGILKRFSEDLDFILCPIAPVSVGIRRSFRKSIIDQIVLDGLFKIDTSLVMVGNSHRFFKVPVLYTMNFMQTSLRPHL
ncbi:MAG: hypothetical protein EOM67_12220 [Spirochaetia bacterium]|nr:hypothetical protein [Spirochaetia bacterium]